ncbi:hypothetical protein Q9Q99_13795 [Curtobacterium flaccumfaciens]|nr:hypothetical protein Q9Q99_13795 [Curtobacterium flaccumfaciens]
MLDKSAYGPTEDPKIAMSIKNSGTNSCHLDLGSAQQVLTISSGQEQYWSSKDCQTGGTNQDVTIKSGQTLTTPAIAWDRTRSSTSTCDSSRPAVTAGGSELPPAGRRREPRVEDLGAVHPAVGGGCAVRGARFAVRGTRFRSVPAVLCRAEARGTATGPVVRRRRGLFKLM